MAYTEQQMTLSVLHRRHGLDPSHFVFFMRHRSQALRTRLRMPSIFSWLDDDLGKADRLLDFGDIGEDDEDGDIIRLFDGEDSLVL